VPPLPGNARADVPPLPGNARADVPPLPGNARADVPPAEGPPLASDERTVGRDGTVAPAGAVPGDVAGSLVTARPPAGAELPPPLDS